MESNRTVQVNWGTFNVPTLLSVLGILWYTATHTERQDNRLEISEANQVTINKAIDDLRAKTSVLDNLTYRMTTAEAKIDGNNVALNARIDRQTDALQSIRDDIGKLSTSFEVVSQKIDNILPRQKTELSPLNMQGPELARRN